MVKTDSPDLTLALLVRFPALWYNLCYLTRVTGR